MMILLLRTPHEYLFILFENSKRVNPYIVVHSLSCCVYCFLQNIHLCFNPNVFIALGQKILFQK